MYETNPPVWKPILGAVVGSIPGLILWTIAGYFGFTWALLGLAIVAGAFMGYEKMGGNVISKSGLITCVLVVLVAVYLGAHLSWAMRLHSALVEYDFNDISLSDCVRHLHAFLDILGMKGKFIGSLLVDYLFAALGAFGFIRRTVGV